MNRTLCSLLGLLLQWQTSHKLSPLECNKTCFETARHWVPKSMSVTISLMGLDVSNDVQLRLDSSWVFVLTLWVLPVCVAWRALEHFFLWDVLLSCLALASHVTCFCVVTGEPAECGAVQRFLAEIPVLWSVSMLFKVHTLLSLSLQFPAISCVIDFSSYGNRCKAISNNAETS